MKHQEFILTFDAGIVDKLGLSQGMNPVTAPLGAEVAHHLFIGQRARLEGDVNFRQILPYARFSKQTEKGKVYLVYRRTKKIGEERLIGGASIGIGGHIDAYDVIIDKDATIDLLETIKLSSQREFFEELNFKDLTDLFGNDEEEVDGFKNIDHMEPHKAIKLSAYLEEHVKVTGFLIDNEGEYKGDMPPVGMVHFGYMLDVDLTDKYDVSIAESELEQVGWMTAEELAISHLPFEPWSKIIIDSGL